MDTEQQEREVVGELWPVEAAGGSDQLVGELLEGLFVEAMQDGGHAVGAEQDAVLSCFDQPIGEQADQVAWFEHDVCVVPLRLLEQSERGAQLSDGLDQTRVAGNQRRVVSSQAQRDLQEIPVWTENA